MLVFFQLVCVGWIIFRAQSIEQIKNMILAVLRWEGQANFSLVMPLLQFAGPLVAYELIQYWLSRDEWGRILAIQGWARSAVYAVIVYLLTLYGASSESFIYFRF